MKNIVKNYLISIPVALVFLMAVFVLDDSYEDATLSAQILDEVIAQQKGNDGKTKN